MTTDPAASGIVELLVDRHDVIVALGTGWDDAATEGNAPALQGDALIGRSLYDFIDGDDTVMFVRVMLAGARSRGTVTVRPYRCDSPTHRRWMEMEMQPRGNGEVLIRHRLLRSALLPSRVAPLSGHGARLPKRCSQCNQLRLDGVWHEPDAPAVLEHLGKAGENFRVIYGICPQCQA